MNKLEILKTVGSGKESVYIYYFPSSVKGDVWPCKIGRTRGSVMYRVLVQQASMLEKPIIGAVIKTASSRSLESYLHVKLKSDRLKAFGSEWFLTTPEKVIELSKFADDVSTLSVGEIIRLTRLQKGITQSQLSKLTGIRQETISLIETGSNVSLKTVEKICASIGKRITLSDLTV